MVVAPICIRMKDGKIMVARRGKPFFPEPVSNDIITIGENEEAFLIGPYPEKNIMIMTFDKYHHMLMELRNHCPTSRSWKITAIVFISMFVIMMMIYLHQCFYAQKTIYHLMQWNHHKHQGKN